MSFIKLNIKTRVRFAARLPQAGVSVNEECTRLIKRVFLLFFSNLHTKYSLCQNQITIEKISII
jgi:hypothetical protein